MGALSDRLLRRFTANNELFAERGWACLNDAERAVIGALQGAIRDELERVGGCPLPRRAPPPPPRAIGRTERRRAELALVAVAASPAGAMVMLK